MIAALAEAVGRIAGFVRGLFTPAFATMLDFAALPAFLAGFLADFFAGFLTDFVTDFLADCFLADFFLASFFAVDFFATFFAVAFFAFFEVFFAINACFCGSKAAA